MSTQNDQREAAQTLREKIWASGIAYGNPPRLWRISPTWYYLWPQQWREVLEFGTLLPTLRRFLDKDQRATYLRADFTLDRRGNLILMELNGCPVWDFGTQIVRDIYHRELKLVEGSFDPFPGAAKKIRELLQRNFPKRRVVIFLGPERLSYRSEYQRLADFFGQDGVTAIATESVTEITDGDVIYRTFANDFCPLAIKTRAALGSLIIWPPPTQLEEKIWMAQAQMTVNLSEFDQSLAKALDRFLPRTWLVDPKLRINLGKRGLDWWDDELMGPRLVSPAKPDKSEVWQWVLKPANGGQGRDVAFSRLLSPAGWRKKLLAALMTANGRTPAYVIQREVITTTHRVSYLDESGTNLIEAEGYRPRLCVSYLVEADQVEVIDADATLRQHPLVHGASDAVILPVVVKS